MKQKKTMAQSKLLILYFMNSAGLRLSELSLMRAMSEKGYVNYFDLKEALFELGETGLLERVQTAFGVQYEVTAAGKTALELFSRDLRHTLRDDIDDYVAASRSQLALETQTHADYMRIGDNEYRVVLRIIESLRPVFEVSLTVYTKKEAARIADGWRDNAADVYRAVLGML